MMRIALCGYSGEGHEVLELRGWKVMEWEANGGYGGKYNAKRERIWFSPHCLNATQMTLIGAPPRERMP